MAFIGDIVLIKTITAEIVKTCTYIYIIYNSSRCGRSWVPVPIGTNQRL